MPAISVSLRIDDVRVGGRVWNRATVIQKKKLPSRHGHRSETGYWKPVAGAAIISSPAVVEGSRTSRHGNMRGLYASRSSSAGLDNPAYGTHSMHRAEKFAAEFQRVIMGEMIERE